MAETVVTEVIVPVAKWSLIKLWQELGYMCCYKSNIGDLNKQVQGLREKRDGVNLEVKPAREALKTIDPGVVTWLGDIDKIMNEKETTFSDDIVAARASCCYGWLPNLRSRHSLGRKAKKMTLEVDELRAKDLGIIAHPAPHPDVEFQPTEESTQLGINFHEDAGSSETSHQEQPPASQGKNIYFESRRSTIADVMEALRGSEINPIIICGLGGIGKTTLMGQVHEKAKAEALFDEYTKASIKESLPNKAPDLSLIQDQLARYLGLPLGGNETEARASKLRERLSQGSKKVLVMLDNVWTTTPNFLWDIGIPPSCRLLVTSRQQDLFKDMDTRKNIPIHELPHRDAWSLFKKTAGSSIESDPELQVVAEMILKECAGLPIAISTVGTALKGASIGIWKNALGEIEKASPENVPGVIEYVYGPIKFSYQSLPEEAKSFFLLSCLFEESTDMLIEELVRYGVGLGLFKGIDSMVEGRNRVETLIHTLKSRFLLLDSDQKECVRMHDVVRDVAAYIASEEFADDRVEKRIVVRDSVETLKLMDLPLSEKNDKSVTIGGRCVLLELFIESESSWRDWLTTIFNKMEDLRHLHIATFSLQVPSLAFMKNLQALYLYWYVGEIDASGIGELRTLKILSFQGSKGLKLLPDTFKNLSDLRILDLTRCEGLEVISPGVISSLTRLEELYMWDSFKDWVSSETSSQLEVAKPAMVEDLLAELLSLTRLNRLEVVLPPVNSVLLSTTLFNKLERFRISIGWGRHLEGWEMSEDMWFDGDGCYLRLHDHNAGSVGSGITWLLKKTSILEFSVDQSMSVLDTICSAKIKHIYFEIGSDVKYLIDTTLVKPPTTPHGSCSPIFPLLGTLKIEDVSKLEQVFHGELPTGSFKELQALVLRSLPALSCVWKINSPSEWGVVRNILGMLQGLCISRCDSFEGIVSFEYENEQVIYFQSLTQLTLDNIRNFNCKNSISKVPEEDSSPKQTDVNPDEVLLRDSSPEQSQSDIDPDEFLLRFSSPEHFDFNLDPWHSSPEQSHVITQFLFNTEVCFPALIKLHISSIDFNEIWNNQLPAESFCELESLKVESCRYLLHLIPTHMQNRLHKLERIEVRYCSSLKEIFDIRRLFVGDEGEAAAGLTNSESGNQRTQINKMVSFKQCDQAFQSLTVISIYGCESLRTLLSHSIAKGLVKLQTLEIENCTKIEEIVAAAAEGDEETEDENMLPQLRNLTLESLPNLGSFSQGKYNFMWPLLEDVKILKCPNMKKFCFGSLSIPKEMSLRVEEERLLQELSDSKSEI